MALSVFIFTWNTQTVRYNTEDGPAEDFIDSLAQEINTENYDLVAIGLQEDAIRDSPLLFDDNSLFPTALAEKYTLLKIVSLCGWGVTTYKALKEEWEYRPRGLRLALFKRCDLLMEITDVQAMEMVCPSIKDWITAGKGGVVINITTTLGEIAFLNVHLPFSSRSIIQDPDNNILRHDAVMWQAKCLRSLYKQTLAAYNPNYIFVFGDLNFRVQLRTECGATQVAERLFSEPEYLAELVKEADELQLLLEYSKIADVNAVRPPVPILEEGVDREGPRFYPTCKLHQGRSADLGPTSFKLGHSDQRTPSWCDRILYTATDELTCTLYDRWEKGTMNYSDHAAVIGAYTLTLTTKNF